MGEEYYQVIGRCPVGVRVKAYVLKNVHNGEVQVIDKDTVYRMAMQKRIVNCSAQEYDGKIVFKGIKFKLTDLPNYNIDGTLQVRDRKQNKHEDLVISSRIVLGKNTIGYILSRRDTSGNIQRAKVTREKVIELAREGKITNARVQRLNNKFLLRGVSCELSQLPVVRA